MIETNNALSTGQRFIRWIALSYVVEESGDERAQHQK